MSGPFGVSATHEANVYRYTVTRHSGHWEFRPSDTIVFAVISMYAGGIAFLVWLAYLAESFVRVVVPRLKSAGARGIVEYQINKIDGSLLIPLGDIPKRYVELDPSDELVMQCKVGGRSAKAADFLRAKGFKKVLNLTGGIVDWIDKVDPSQPKY